MHAIILIAPWQCLQTVTSMLNTRFSRIAQLIFPRRSSQSAGKSVVAIDGSCFARSRYSTYFPGVWEVLGIVCSSINSLGLWELSGVVCSSLIDSNFVFIFRVVLIVALSVIV